MGSKSRETIYGASVRAAAERAAEARKGADRLAVEAWNKRMLGFQGPAQPSPTLGDAINAGFGYLEVKCLGCNTHQTVALDIVRRPKTTPVHELQGLLGSSRLSVQAQPSGGAARRKNLGERSALEMVAGRAVIQRASAFRSPQKQDLPKAMPKDPQDMTLEELSLDLRKRADSLDHLTARGEMDRRLLIATMDATEAQKAAAQAAKNNATYMLWSVIVAAMAAVASAISAIATAYSVFPKKVITDGAT
jgi:hypothetical protein